MKKRILAISAMISGMLLPVSCLYAEQYCPEDGGDCYETAPLQDAPQNIASPIISSGSEGYVPSWGSGPAYGGDYSRGVSRNMLQVGGGDNSANGSTQVTFRDNFLRNIQVYIMGLLGIVSVSVFLYIGYMLFTAQGKEEDFKNAWKALTYAVVGLAIIPLAYIVVKIVTGFTF